MKKFNVFYLVVVFNKKIDETNTFNSLIKQGVDIASIIIWDNSTNNIIKSYNYDYFNNKNAKYYPSKVNQSLSKIYNNVFSDIFNFSKNDFYLILLDDDTVVNRSYIDEVKEISKRNTLFACPQIKSLNKAYSPAYYMLFKNKAIEHHGFKTGKITGVMSGVVIHSTLYELVKFDEMLSFYGVDTKYFLDVSYSNNIPVYVMKSELIHSLSINESYSDISNIRRRFLNVKGASSYINWNLRLDFFVFKTLIDLIVSVRLCFKYKTCGFLNNGTLGLHDD